MSEQLPSTNDEIDLGQLIKLVRKGIFQVLNFLLKVYVYLRKNALKLTGLVLLGVAISLGLKAIVPEKLKTEVIVKPNFESKNYLYDVVDEITANIKTKDEQFFKALNIDVIDLKGFDISVKAIEDDKVKTEEMIQEEMRYLEILQNFKNESFVLDIIKSELSQKSVIQHKITFKYKDANTGPEIALKLMNYMNTNSYFDELRIVYAENAQNRIEKNNGLIAQIDDLVANYSKTFLADNAKREASMVYMEKDNSLNVPSLLSLKNTLIKEIEEKKLELKEQTKALSIINMGKTQKIKKPVYNQNVVLIPLMLVVMFFVVSLIKFLNRKSKEIVL